MVALPSSEPIVGLTENPNCRTGGDFGVLASEEKELLVNASEANLQPNPAPDRPAGGRADPWGVRRAENLVTSLQGVLSARVEVSPMGEVTAVHVLTHSGLAPKQVVRNVESALLAQLGLKVDHRKISVAQTAEVKPIEALEKSVVREEAARRHVVFKGVEVVSSGESRVVVRVTLLAQGEEASAEEEVANTHRARMTAAARASLNVLNRLLTLGTLDLDGVRQVEGFDSRVVLVAVHALEGRNSHMVLGTATVQESAERAAVLAVLDATNRWVQWRT
jgi:hypothetical protein